MRYFDLDSAELPVLQITYNHLWTNMGADCRVQGKVPMLSTPPMCFQLLEWLVCWCYQPIIGWKCWSTSRPERHFHLDYKPIPSSSKMSNPPKEPSLVNKLSWRIKVFVKKETAVLGTWGSKMVRECVVNSLFTREHAEPLSAHSGLLTLTAHYGLLRAFLPILVHKVV